MLFLYGRNEDACSMVKSLLKTDFSHFSHPSGHYRQVYENVCSPIDKIMGAAPA